MRDEGVPIRVFYSYSHADEALLNNLRLHLASLRRRGLIVEWHDRAIDAGARWADEIKHNLTSADLVLLLISTNFINSDFCYGTEMTAALERDDRGEARVVPVILSPCRWLKLPFARLQAVPRDNRAVTSSYWKNEDEALDEVAGHIEEVVEALCAKSEPPQAPSAPLPQAGEGDARQGPRQLAGEEGAHASGRVRAAPKDGVTIGADPRELPDLAVFKDADAPWCPEMVVIPAGSYLMGSPPDEDDRGNSEGPRHQVTIGYRFALGRYPLTVGEYRRFIEASGHRQEGGMWVWTGSGSWTHHESKSWRDPGFAQTDKQPVVGISWQDAVAYCGWLGSETGKSYRLPSEAEWEYACRARTTTRYAFGDYVTPKDANYNGRLERTREVGAYPSNAWGLYGTATYGSGWRTFSTPATTVRRTMVQLGLRRKEYNPLTPASTAVAPGSTIRGASVRRSATGTAPTTASTTLGSGLLGRFLRTGLFTSLPLGSRGVAPWSARPTARG